MFNATHTIEWAGETHRVELSGPDMQQHCRPGEVHVFMESGTPMLCQQRELTPITPEPYDQQSKQGRARMAERFVRLITPKRRQPAKVTEHGEYVAMMQRMIRALEARACDDANVLPMVRELEIQLGEVIAVAIATQAARYNVNPFSGASEGECGRALNITKQSANERAKRGRAIIARRLAAANAIPFSEARREREARERAEQAAAVSLAEYRARHQRTA